MRLQSERGAALDGNGHMIEIETRLFRYFVALAEERHFGRAAIHLEISPPTLTNQIQKLESRLGAKLVERRGNTHIELTEAGKRFLERARNVLREAAEAEAVAQQAARGEIGRLEIGFMTVASLTGLLEKCVGAFQKQNPGIEMVLRTMVTIDQINAILGRTLDFGFARVPERYPIGLCGFVVSHQPMLLALPRDHPLAGQKRIEPAALKGESFINTSPELDVGFWKHTNAVGTLGGFSPKIVRRAKDMISILSCVSAGQGVAVVSRAFTKLQLPNVLYREFKTDAPPTASIAFIYRDNESSSAARAFIKFMRRHEVTR
jgi:DNA-binding transcriptional LysR family regulator